MAVVTSSLVSALRVGFQREFQDALSSAPSQWDRLSTRVPSSSAGNTYGWIGQFPKLREWSGDRSFKNIKEHGYSVMNNLYEATVDIPRTAVEDDDIGVYAPLFREMGYAAGTHPDEIVFGLLKNGMSGTCYDGKAFFATDHDVAGKSVSNKLTDKLSADAYKTARAMMLNYKNSKGRSLGLVPDLLVVPPALEAAARDILVADYVSGTKNTMQGTADIHVEPRLTSDTAWFLLATKRPIKPLIYQQRKKAKFVSITDETSPNVFMSKKFLYGADSRGNAGFGFWQMGVGSDGTKV